MNRTLIKFFIGLLYVSIVTSCNLSPGSYPNAEIYEFDMKEEELIKVIEQVKNENQDIDLTLNVQIPNGGTFELLDERKDHWYSFYFYYPDKNQIIKTWTRSTFEGTSQFAFVGTNQSLTIGNWIDPNSESIKEFEVRILKKVKQEVKNTKAQQNL